MIEPWPGQVRYVASECGHYTDMPRPLCLRCVERKITEHGGDLHAAGYEDCYCCCACHKEK